MWLHVPSEFCPSAPESEESTSASSCSSDEGPELFVTLSGKPSARPLSWHAWKRRPWIQLLSGTISRPSMAARGVERWISSVRASHVSPGVLPGRSAGPMTSVGSGTTSPASSARSRLPTCSSRTSTIFCQLLGEWWESTQGSLFAELGLDLYCEPFPVSGSMRSGTCSAGTKSERRRFAGASSLWPTATARDDGKSPEAHLAMKKRMGSGRKAATSLSVVAKMWAAPCARDSKGAESPDRSGRSVASDARMWPNPVAAPTSPRLAEKSKLWPTANTRDSASAGRHSTTTGVMHPGTTLTDAVRLWPGPSARDYKGARPLNGTALRDSWLQLPDAAERWVNPLDGPQKTSSSISSEPHSPTPQDEKTPGPSSQASSRLLNPRFVEWLMGYAPGWTDFMRLEMRSFRLWWLSQLNCLHAAREYGKASLTAW